MVTKWPRWVWAGGWVLSFVAGMINVVGFLGFTHQGITHLTGTTTLLGAAISHGDLAAALHFGALLASFVAGSALSGWIIGDSTLQLGKRYGVTLLLESLIICVAVQFLSRGSAYGEWLAAAACGLQNAMATTYSGATLRTCHVSGMFTDLGIYLGHGLRGTRNAPKRLQLCLVVITGFLMGAIAGALLFQRWQYQALYVPALITGMSGGLYSLYRLGRDRDQPPSTTEP